VIPILIKEPGWQKVMAPTMQQDYYDQIFNFIAHQKQLGKTVFPPENLIFNAFELTSFEKVKVVIIGQDPYPAKGQAHGLSFSVPKEIPIPRSLQNIYKELAKDVNKTMPTHGNLEQWARQGVLLLNATLTVNEGETNSHSNCGWQLFTDEAILQLSEHHQGLVFMLWGNFAKSKSKLIDANKHLILKCAHPSPLSVKGMFFQLKMATSGTIERSPKLQRNSGKA
jgi:uracil-DNA glycosylase